eukprot:scaffold2322_cov135-Cylindrotheca_fusiformis.AAC.4
MIRTGYDGQFRHLGDVPGEMFQQREMFQQPYIATSSFKMLFGKAWPDLFRLFRSGEVPVECGCLKILLLKIACLFQTQSSQRPKLQKFQKDKQSMGRSRYILKSLKQEETDPSVVWGVRENVARCKNANKQKRNRKTTWAKSSVYIEIDHISDLELAVIQDQWLSADELQEIKEEAEETLRIMTMNGKQIIADDDEEFCLRGLEVHTKQGRRRRRKNRNIVYNEVLSGQHLNRFSNEISSVCSQQTCQNQLEAINRAKADRDWVQKYLATAEPIGY